jgi:PAS domain S-box-containing protein
VAMQSDFRETEEGYRLLFESNPQPMWIYDRDTLAFLAVNNAAIHDYGYSLNEFLAMTIKDIRPPEDVPWLLEKIASVKPGMNSASSRHLTKEGNLIEVEIVSHTLQYAGRRAELVLAMNVSNPKTARTREYVAEPARDMGRPEDSSFTNAEMQVARYVARGFSNKQIAAALRVSVRTVENHISHIFAKKSFANRVELARYVLENEP